MENNEAKYVIDPSLEAFADKCLAYIQEKKLDIEIDNYKVYINDDVLNRFLRAREGKEEKAFAMWCQWAEWRVQYKPESIQDKDIKNELMSGKAYLHGFDKEGRPCIVVKNCKHIPEKTDIEELIRFFIHLVESACKLADETPHKQICIIADRENTGYANFDKRLLGKMNLASMLQDFYAERLHRVYILHVNWVFKMVQALVRPFLSEKTKSKMMVLSGVEELKTHFTEDNLQKEHGGTSDFVYSYNPEKNNKSDI